MDDDIKDEIEDIQVPDNPLDDLNKEDPNFPIRYDFQIQEDATEHYLNPIAIIQSHFSYWASKDVAFFILKTVHGRHEQIPIVSLLTSVEAKAKKLALSTTDEKLKQEFLKLAERAAKEHQYISAEEAKLKVEGLTLRSAWNLITKNADVDLYSDEFYTFDVIDDDQ